MIFHKPHPRSNPYYSRSAAIEFPISAIEAHIRDKVEASDDLAEPQNKTFEDTLPAVAAE